MLFYFKIGFATYFKIDIFISATKKVIGKIIYFLNSKLTWKGQKVSRGQLNVINLSYLLPIQNIDKIAVKIHIYQHCINN